MNKIIAGVLLMTIMSTLTAQQVIQVIPLYDGAVPNAKPCNETDHEFIDTSWMKAGILIVDHITKPTLTIFEPSAEKKNGTAVIICPGGGYSVIAAGHEGSKIV